MHVGKGVCPKLDDGRQFTPPIVDWHVYEGSFAFMLSKNAITVRIYKLSWLDIEQK